MSKYIKLLRAIRVADSWFILILILSSFFKMLTVFIPIYFSQIIINDLSRQTNSDFWLKVLIFIILMSFSCVISNVLNTKYKTRVETISMLLENELARKSLKFSFSELEKTTIQNLREAAKFPIRNQNAFKRLSSSLQKLITNLFSSVSAFLILVQTAPEVLIISAIILSCGVIITNISERKVVERSRLLIPFNRKLEYYGDLAENFRFTKDINIFRIQGFLTNKYHLFIENSNKIINRDSNLISILFGLSSFTGAINLFVCIIIIVEKSNSDISLGILTASISALLLLNSSFSEALTNISTIRNMILYVEDYFSYLLISTTSKMQNSFKSIPVFNEFNNDNVIEFRNVSFEYPNTNNVVLSNVSFTIKKNETISIVGENGAGKSTLINLLLRLYSPSEGEIRLNGINIEEIDLNKYYHELGIVFQDFKLFPITIKENIAFDSPVNVDKLRKVLSAVGLLEKVDSLEGNINAKLFPSINKNGVNFSGGQAQRLAISRALIKNPQIIIMDEPTASLDPRTEMEIFELLFELTKNCTAIFISHRLSSCKFADKIIVLKEGTIVEEGAHRDLISANGYYSKLFKEQGEMYELDMVRN